MDKKEYDRKWYAKHKGRIRVTKNKNCNLRRLRNLQLSVDFLRKNPCVDCGEDDFIVLEFDHKCCKTRTISDLVKSGASIDRLEEEIAKCEVRCANCHRRKTAKQLGWYKGVV